jgi:hypothetical protein
MKLYFRREAKDESANIDSLARVVAIWSGTVTALIPP